MPEETMESSGCRPSVPRPWPHDTREAAGNWREAAGNCTAAEGKGSSIMCPKMACPGPPTAAQLAWAQPQPCPCCGIEEAGGGSRMPPELQPWLDIVLLGNVRAPASMRKERLPDL